MHAAEGRDAPATLPLDALAKEIIENIVID